MTKKTLQSTIYIRPATKSDSKIFLTLLDALADYEKLKRPTRTARLRLIEDAFGKRKRFDAFLAFVDDKPVGYAIIFETYSSFLAKPTLYLEDIFVLEEYRRFGIGKKFFDVLVKEARKRKCGRVEWTVLDWNTPAINFYDKLGAKQMKEWLLYRIVL
ncbi:MAG: GNAT family N-acetyltransferase [Ignavibacteriae bacterium]|nr:GNAT family N-acetyltransferase [Ignavibacteriota bacterium]